MLQCLQRLADVALCQDCELHDCRSQPEHQVVFDLHGLTVQELATRGLRRHFFGNLDHHLVHFVCVRLKQLCVQEIHEGLPIRAQRHETACSGVAVNLHTNSSHCHLRGGPISVRDSHMDFNES